ncbi:MAG: hypothetical protein JWO59_686 [Chloroflexi bacterium]|nr:hypothetical protein [Chloroflexota bacterium]
MFPAGVPITWTGKSCDRLSLPSRAAASASAPKLLDVGSFTATGATSVSRAWPYARTSLPSARCGRCYHAGERPAQPTGAGAGRRAGCRRSSRSENVHSVVHIATSRRIGIRSHVPIPLPDKIASGAVAPDAIRRPTLCTDAAENRVTPEYTARRDRAMCTKMCTKGCFGRYGAPSARCCAPPSAVTRRDTPRRWADSPACA